MLNIEYKDIANLILHKQLVFKKGKIDLLGETVTFVPLSTHITEIRFFEKKKMESGLYTSAKYTGVTWNRKMHQKYSTKTPREIFEWGNKVMNLAGYGEFVVYREDDKKQEYTWRLYNSEIAKRYVQKYGKTRRPVCHRPRGFFAGAMSFVSGTDLDAVEVKCKAKGDPHCEFLIKKKKGFRKTDPLVKAQLNGLL
jgi:predicted hydrocarbon binding protein